MEDKKMTILELRKMFKLSQAALAKRLGVTPGTISQIENGRMQISDMFAEKIWAEFGVDIHKGDNPKPVKTIVN